MHKYKLLPYLISCRAQEGLHTTQELLRWIKERNTELETAIIQIPIESCEDWFYDAESGSIHNRQNTFFSVSGVRWHQGETVKEQPILVQTEIGYLGILCCEINGVLHFLMQAKIEPGNINKIQLSPTIQATKSNFTQMHGGSTPAYLEYFTHAEPKDVLVDQIQSEQSSRFYKKRNRNVIVLCNTQLPEPLTHRWMTLGQIHALLKFDNIVNMDTRTVLSCIPYSMMDRIDVEMNTPILRSVCSPPDTGSLAQIYSYINNYKMFALAKAELIDLYTLRGWEMQKGEFISEAPSAFKLIFCDISIEGREVRRWSQPLFAATGIATFGLLCSMVQDKLRFLVRARAEVGCFDGLELGPTLQREPMDNMELDVVESFFLESLNAGRGVVFDTLLSEEGGRFYHEQNRNVILETDMPFPLPQGYFWVDYSTLNTLVQVNNCLNIQLRNLLSILEI